jgi:hypothetical protein
VKRRHPSGGFLLGPGIAEGELETVRRGLGLVPAVGAEDVHAASINKVGTPLDQSRFIDDFGFKARPLVNVRSVMRLFANIIRAPGDWWLLWPPESALDAQTITANLHRFLRPSSR